MKTLKQSDYKKAIDEAKKAKELLESEEFKFFRDYLVRKKEEVIDNAVNNRLKKRVLKYENQEVVYEKWEQEAEEAGKFKFIYEIIDFLQSVVKTPKYIENAIKEGRLKIID